MTTNGLILLLVIACLWKGIENTDVIWKWECQAGNCQRTRVTNEVGETIQSLAACQLLCNSYGRLWPRPTGDYESSNDLLSLDKDVEIRVPERTPITEIGNIAATRFQQQILRLIPSDQELSGGSKLVVDLVIDDTSVSRLTYVTDESYSLKVVQDTEETINATIVANTFFGARHGLETLSQLIVYDDINNELLMPSEATITDSPRYPHRGVMMDTSRNYIPVDVIKRTIDGMAASKLNTFHWHITDSQSFPFVSKSNPSLSKLGAYSADKVYTPETITELLIYGRSRGVRLLPEFDAPAHVGQGWQDTGFVACLDGQPWNQYCGEPPCGQIDPTQDGVYDVLEGIYGDMMEAFQPDVFHMGGDEMDNRCWNSTESIVKWMVEEQSWGTTAGDFLKLWNYFQERALQRLYETTGERIPVIVWTSDLTYSQDVQTYLPKDTYIIQVWTSGTDPLIPSLLSQGYRLIISNYDALYLPCGFGNWISGGIDWCSPYKGWQKIYENSMREIAGENIDQILGAEAALWTERVDSPSVDGRIWPRAAALGERLWSEPSDSWEDAQARMLVHRERLVNMGINAEALKPEFCLQNEGHC